MTGFPRTRFVSKSAAAGAYDADARRAWLLLLSKGRAVAAGVVAGERVDRWAGPELAGLTLKIRHPFPLAYPSAIAAGAAFTILLRAFVECGWPTSLAAFVVAGVDALEGMLIADGHAQAERSRRQMGEAD